MEDNTPEKRSLQRALRENRTLLEENNELLRKLHRNAVWAFWIRILWYIVLIGLPFALYFYILEPYFTALGSSYEKFNEGIQEIPGIKQINQTLETYQQQYSATTSEPR